MTQYEQDAVKLAKNIDNRSKLARRATVAMSLAFAMNSFVAEAVGDYDLPSFPECHDSSTTGSGIPEYPFKTENSKVGTEELASKVVRLAGLRTKTPSVVTASAQVPSDSASTCSSPNGSECSNKEDASKTCELALPVEMPKLEVPTELPLPAPPSSNTVSQDLAPNADLLSAADSLIDVGPQLPKQQSGSESPIPALPPVVIPNGVVAEASSKAPELVRKSHKMTLSIGQEGESRSLPPVNQESLLDLGEDLLSSVGPEGVQPQGEEKESLLSVDEDLINAIAAGPEAPSVSEKPQVADDGSFHLSDSSTNKAVVQSAEIEEPTLDPAPQEATMAELIAADQPSKTPQIVSSPAREPKRIKAAVPQPAPVQAEPIELSPVQVAQVPEPALVPLVPAAVASEIPSVVRPSPIQTAAAAAPSRSLESIPVASKSTGPAVQLDPQAAQLLRSSKVIAEMSVEYPDICKLIPNGEKSVTCIGLKPGVTRVALITLTASGERHLELREVTVGKSTNASSKYTDVAAEVTETIIQLYPASDVTVTARDGKLIVTGKAESEQDARKILSLVRKASLTPVVDKLKTY